MIVRVVLGILIGGGIGGLLGYFGKCSSGACPLTANPWRGMVIGSLIGVLFAWSLGNRGASYPEYEKDAKEGGLYITSAEDFESLVLGSGKPVMVDFYSPGCGACSRLSPTVAQLKARYRDKAEVYKVDASKLRGLAKEHDVEVVPTVAFFQGGHYLRRLVGAKGADVYASILDAMLGGEISPQKEDPGEEKETISES